MQSSYSAHRQSSMQMQMSQSLNASPQKGSKAKHDDLIRNKQEFSAFDLPIGGKRNFHSFFFLGALFTSEDVQNVTRLENLCDSKEEQLLVRVV